MSKEEKEKQIWLKELVEKIEKAVWEEIRELSVPPTDKQKLASKILKLLKEN